MLYVGKDVVAQPGDRVILSKEGSAWCQQRYPVRVCPDLLPRVSVLPPRLPVMDAFRARTLLG